jgi:hypothetical protein
VRETTFKEDGEIQDHPNPNFESIKIALEGRRGKAEGGHSDTPPYRRRSVSFAAGDGFFGRLGSRSVDSKPSRRAVRRTRASSGECPAAPDARPQSFEALPWPSWH